MKKQQPKFDITTPVFQMNEGRRMIGEIKPLLQRDLIVNEVDFFRLGKILGRLNSAEFDRKEALPLTIVAKVVTSNKVLLQVSFLRETMVFLEEQLRLLPQAREVIFGVLIEFTAFFARMRKLELVFN